MIYLTREQILNANDLKTEEVNVPEWGGTVVIKMMTGKQRDAFEASLMGEVDPKNPKSQKMVYNNIRAKLVAMSIIDPATKELMFNVADVEVLGTKSAAALDRVFTASQKLSGVTEEDVEELVKNSLTDQPDTSTIN